MNGTSCPSPSRPAGPGRVTFGLAGIVLALALLVTAPVRGADAARLDIREVTGESGVTGWLLRDPSIPLISVDFAFRGGSALDPDGKGGLAEMVSGLLDEGAGDLTSEAFLSELENRSISMRFDAGKDVFSGSLQSLRDQRGRAAEMLSLALTRPRFDPAPVARIRAQILSQIRRNRERPSAIAAREWNALVFGDHPYGRPHKGTEESVSAIATADLRDFIDRRLARDNLLVAAVGDMTEAEFAHFLDTAFGGLPAHAAAWKLPEADLRDDGPLAVIQRDIPQSVAIFGHEGPKRDDPDWYGALILNHVLGGGALTSRLGTEIREQRGLAYSVYSRLVPYRFAGLVSGGVATQNTRIRESLDLVRSEWRLISENGITASELTDAKTYLKGAFYTGLTSTGRIARMLLGMQLDGLDREHLNRRDDLIEAVTLDDTGRIARDLFRPEALAVVVVGQPDGVAERGETPGLPGTAAGGAAGGETAEESQGVKGDR